MTPSYILNLKSLAKVVAEISREFQNFGECSPSPDLAQFWPQKLFLATLLYDPNLCTKFEIYSFNCYRNKKGSQHFLGASLANTPANFDPKSCFGMLLPAHKLHNKF